MHWIERKTWNTNSKKTKSKDALSVSDDYVLLSFYGCSDSAAMIHSRHPSAIIFSRSQNVLLGVFRLRLLLFQIPMDIIGHWETVGSCLLTQVLLPQLLWLQLHPNHFKLPLPRIHINMKRDRVFQVSSRMTLTEAQTTLKTQHSTLKDRTGIDKDNTKKKKKDNTNDEESRGMKGIIIEFFFLVSAFLCIASLVSRLCLHHHFSFCLCSFSSCYMNLSFSCLFD